MITFVVSLMECLSSIQKKWAASFCKVAEHHIPYLSQWFADQPAVILPSKYQEFKKLQQILFKAICHFQEHLSEFVHLFPLSGFIEKLIRICAPYPYRIGTYRPDFLIDGGGNILICEIGARFPLNGYFLSGFAEQVGRLKFPLLPHPPQRAFDSFLDYLFGYWGGVFNEVCVLKGADRPCDIKYYVPFFEEMGIKVTLLSPETLSQNPSLLEGKAVINEFNQMEMMSCSMEVLEAIAASNALNDMRTIFLLHDKRFLSVLCNSDFTSHFLSDEERLFLQQRLIPTYTASHAPEKWREAKENKDMWLLKHALLGKSERLFAGPLCSTKEWEALFLSKDLSNMVLQPFILQKSFSFSIGSSLYTDYVTGTLLCGDSAFFGPGLFRTSSCAVANRTDDRKMAPFIANSEYFTGGIVI
jgi:hypothetical protein